MIYLFCFLFFYCHLKWKSNRAPKNILAKLFVLGWNIKLFLYFILIFWCQSKFQISAIQSQITAFHNRNQAKFMFLIVLLRFFNSFKDLRVSWIFPILLNVSILLGAVHKLRNAGKGGGFHILLWFVTNGGGGF